jgi:hypothetical protein
MQAFLRLPNHFQSLANLVDVAVFPPVGAVSEALSVEGEPPFAPRPVTITKQAPALWIASGYEPEVRAGSIVSFTLSYSNGDGFLYRDRLCYTCMPAQHPKENKIVG